MKVERVAVSYGHHKHHHCLILIFLLYPVRVLCAVRIDLSASVRTEKLICLAQNQGELAFLLKTMQPKVNVGRGTGVGLPDFRGVGTRS